MQSQTPIRDLLRFSSHIGVLLNQLHGRVRIRSARSGQEIEIQDPSNDIILQGGALCSTFIPQLHVHPVRIEQEDAVGARMRLAWCGAAVLKVDGVVPVQIRPCGDAICVAGPERQHERRVPRVGRDREPEGVRVLAQPVDVDVTGACALSAQLRLDAQIGVFEYQLAPDGCEQDLFRSVWVWSCA